MGGQHRGGWGRFVLFAGVNLAAVVSLGLLIFVPAYDYLEAQRAEIGYRQSRLTRERTALTQNATGAALVQAKLTEVASRFIKGDNASVSNADLLTRLRKIAEARSVTFTSLATLPPHDWLGRQLVGARVEFSGGSRTVSDVLTDIEDGPCFLFIQRAHFTADKIDGADEAVSISLEVYGVTG